MTNITKKMQMIVYAFKDVTTKASFDPVAGCKVVNTNDKVCTVPKKMYDQIMTNQKGCSFTFAAYMIYLLHQNGVSASIIMAERGGDLTSAVLYTDKDERYVANPSNDIEIFTTNNIDSETRNLMYDTDGTLITDSSAVNSARIPFYEFKKEFNKVSELDLYKDTDTTLQEALDNMKQIR